jgi:hypothetical protein
MDASRVGEKFDESRLTRRVKIFDGKGEKREQDHRLKLCQEPADSKCLSHQTVTNRGLQSPKRALKAVAKNNGWRRICS